MKGHAFRSIVAVGATLVLLLAIGCNGAKQTADPGNSGKSSGSDTPGKKPVLPPPTQAGADQGPPGLPLDKIPDSVKNAAFEYYGLSNAAPVNYEVTITGRPPETASQILKLLKVEGDSARFSLNFTGPLKLDGDQEMVLNKDGLFVVKMLGKDLEKPLMELPSSLDTGKKWKTSFKSLDPSGASVEIEMSYVVAGPEKVNTKAGEFDAIRVNATSVTKKASAKFTSTLTGWYAKGTGQVKMIVKGFENAPDGAMTVELTK